MKYLIPFLLASSLVAAEGRNEAEVLIFGVSHHFQNRSEYNYHEINPGFGAAYWRSVGNGFSFGGTAARFINSYARSATTIMGEVRYQFGESDDWHTGIEVGYGAMTGYVGPVFSAVVAGYSGYDRFNLHYAVMPNTAAKESKADPQSTAVAVWIGYTIARW
jgi:hypothetical protein